ncbi:hypothetical protein B0I35DRAFT_406602 [Stachybotrys elegans]|uniref:Uncharacterized protein n=1 Tax=Stachybotrys elegans TaxID=80388 RepID=A0A8K0SW99_9HYPO|nr:hypothetical protein B0I35DRAFT_406602 [Stachybotrys elegans]
MAWEPRKYVAAGVLGGTVEIDALAGAEADGQDDSGELYWPKVPQSYQPPPPELEHAVKEVWYITELLSIAQPLTKLDADWVLEYTNAFQALNKPLPPLATPSSANKLDDWKLELSDQASEEADKLFALLKTQRTNAVPYFQTNRPPQPHTAMILTFAYGPDDDLCRQP